jgi:thiamine biosynthesis lipoprotein
MAIGYFVASGRSGRSGEDVTREFEVMRTRARLFIPAGSGSSLAPSELADLAEAAIREIDRLMSPVGEDSDIRRLNSISSGVWIEVHPLTWRVVMEALRWHRLTGGAFDPTIGPVKRLFKFDRSEDGAWPDAGALADAKKRVGAQKLLFDREGMRLSWAQNGMSLDLGAIAKGFSVDRAADVLRDKGVRNAIIDVGGELFLMGMKPGDPPSAWRTGIRHPREGDILETLELSDRAVATSGDYENYFIHNGERHEHIIDPRSGLPLSKGIASVTVVHPGSCLAADAAATAFSVLGPEQTGEFIKNQSLGLFSRGIQAIIVSIEPAGGFSRREYSLDDKGALRTEESRIGENP